MMMYSPDSQPPPFAELGDNPLPESATVYRPLPVEAVDNAPPELNTSHRPQPIESMPGPPPELNVAQKHHETTMGDHYNAAIAIASSSTPPFSTEAGVEEEIAPPAYDRSLLPTSSRTLRKPIVIPATTGKLGSPFLRCYPPILEQYHLPKDVFLKHLDLLNKVAVASPPFQVLSFADEVALPFTGIISGIARLGSNGVSYGRTEMFLKDINKDVFGPRGLKIEIASMNAVARVAKMPVVDANGKVRTDTKLLENLELHELQTTSGHQRRLRALTPWIEEVEVIPTIAEKAGMFRNVSSRMSEHDRKKHEKQLLRQRRQWHEQHMAEMSQLQAEFDRRMTDLEWKEAEAMREQNMVKKEAKMDKLLTQRERFERDFETKRTDLDRRRGDNDVEEQEMRNTKWLMITPLGDTKRTASSSETPVESSTDRSSV